MNEPMTVGKLIEALIDFDLDKPVLVPIDVFLEPVVAVREHDDGGVIIIT